MTSRGLALAILGVTYAGFSLALYAKGISPRAVLLPIPASHYYLAQAFFVGPLFVLLAYVFARVTATLAGVGAKRSTREIFDALGPRFAWPIVLLFLLPDIVVFLSLGHAALAPLMRYYAPLAPIVILAMTSQWLHRHADVNVLRGLAASFGGLVVQALLGAPLLR